jgi:hypothetical protein
MILSPNTVKNPQTGEHQESELSGDCTEQLIIGTLIVTLRRVPIFFAK